MAFTKENNAVPPSNACKMLGTIYTLSILIIQYHMPPLRMRLYRFFGTKRLGLPFLRDGGGGPGGRLVC